MSQSIESISESCIIVIQPQNEPDVCGICLDVCNLQVKVTCGHMFCYLCIKQWCYSFALTCPLCRKSIDANLIEKACAEDDLKESELLWQYESRTKGEWWYYNKDLDSEIENGWKNKKESLTVDILGIIYHINFKTMKQISPSGAMRNIRRISNSNDDTNDDTRGIAGLIFKDKFKNDYL